MEAIYFNTRKELDLISGNLEISKQNQTPAVFMIFPSFSSSSSHFWFPEAHQEQTRSKPAAGVTQLHPVGLGGPDLNCEIVLHKLQAQEKAQTVQAHEFTPWEEGEALVKGMESLLQLVAFYTLLPDTSLAPPHWTASFKNPLAQWVFSP